MKQLFLILTVASCGIINAQTPDWVWSQHTGGQGQYANMGTSICTDPNGNILVTGFFTDSVIQFGNVVLANSGFSNTSNYFIVKLDGFGNLIWAKTCNGTGPRGGNSVTSDNSGNVYVTGRFMHSITFDSLTLTDVNNPGNYDLFIVKYDSNGNVLWAKSAGGNETDAGSSITCDSLGNPLVLGNYRSASIIFGNDTLVNSFTGWNDIFLVKYDTIGNILWAKDFGGTGDDISRSVITDLYGNIIISGDFKSFSVNFGPFTLINDSIISYDIYIAKFDFMGNSLWAKRAGGYALETGADVAADFAGNVFLTGTYASSSLMFDTITLVNSTPGGGGELYLAKYDASGNVLWAKSAGTVSYEYSTSVSVDNFGNAHITGRYFNNPCHFDSIVLPTSGLMDIFVAKYSSGGNVLWAKQVGGTGTDESFSITTTPNGACYITGSFMSQNITFDTLIINSGIENIFIAKLDYPTGLHEFTGSSDTFSVYPNPFSSELNISYLNHDLGNIHITIYDIYGRVIFENTSINDNFNPIVSDLSYLRGGIYLLKLDVNHNKYATKIIKYQ